MSRRRHFSVEHQQAAGRARAVQFTREQRVAAGSKGSATRVQQHSFQEHVRSIAPDGPARQRVILRASKGSRLLKASDVHFVCLEDIHGDLGDPWPEEKRRLLLARYIWAYVWENLDEPPRPTHQEFLRLAAKARERVGHRLPLLNPLHVVGVAPNDFCNAVGRAYCVRNQRTLFRQALREARAYACLIQAIGAYFAALEVAPPAPHLRVLGRRMPMSEGSVYLLPTRPIRLPLHWQPICTLFDHQRVEPAYQREPYQGSAYWLPPALPTADEPGTSSEGEHTYDDIAYPL
jgi:hypothetical protein